MCGIAGAWVREPLPPDRLQECLHRMEHRGPDHQAVQMFGTGSGTLYLLHSRLTILDFSEAAHQPFTHGGKTLTYNGELYNYVELRERLQNAGRAFATSGDTEVLAQWLDEHGLGGLDACEGMWAFALYDELRETLTFCRDRFGEKPLYVTEDATGLYFGSEPKFLFALMGHTLPVNRNHVRRFLVNGYKSLYKTRETFFEDMWEVPPATMVTVRGARAGEPVRYWQPALALNEALTFEDAVAGTRARLIQAVRLRLRADVPVAFCLSGGVDSNALVAIASRVLGHEVHGFTIVNEDARYEEKDMVDRAVADLGLRHTAITLNTTGFLDHLQTLVRQHDAPVVTITYYAHWLLMQAVAAAGYRVVQSGTGADELFTGYYDHQNFYLAEVHGDPARYAEALAAWKQHIAPIVRNPLLQDPEAFVKAPHRRDHITLGAEEFSALLTKPFAEAFTEEHYHDSLLRNRTLNELFHESVPVILHEDDCNAMACSLENRSPFLDRHLFEFAASIPPRLLIRDAMAKAVLRGALAGIVHDDIRLNRRKVGFNAPIHALLDTQDPAVRARLLEDSPLFEVVRREAVEKLLNQPTLPNSESKFLFSVLSCKFFLEAFA